MLDMGEYLKIFIALLVIMDPLGAVPLFVSLTGGHSAESRNDIARTASIAMGIVCIVTIFIGESLLHFFGISIASFKIGGGILLMLMAMEMMQAMRITSKHTAEEDREAETKGEIGVVPMAIPLLTGPGAISTIIIYSNRSDHIGHRFMIIGCCLIIVLLTWLTLRTATRVSHMIGKTGINIAIRLMGLILSAIAVEFIASGAAELFPVLRGILK